ncbi:hypothetical protein [Ornithinimicrobium pratense]|uniref:Uncharacterized protein n=1 Tax=Ornithinimicrobium pratense TaxID=2593973 RepID=A0A5J6V1L2_9MICO|nr:hypothetical protein [Ornithinimicrobium pratense]QFG67690.1 hypothetical protein FY030_02160 [Ornithinimicrobium pratense]
MPQKKSTTVEQAKTHAGPDPTLVDVRTLVIVLSAVLVGVMVGILTWAAEAPNIWGAILAGLIAAGAAIPILNKLVAHSH